MTSPTRCDPRSRGPDISDESWAKLTTGGNPVSKAKQALSLTAFARGKTMEARRAECPVCQLPAEVREQIASASDRGIKQPTVVEWLREMIGVEIARDALQTHRNGRHDEAA